MKGTRKQLLTTLGLALTLTACGGGGGGGDAGNGGGQTPVGSSNRAPTISGFPLDAVEAGTAYSFVPTASDPDGDTLSFSIQNAPLLMMVDEKKGEISGKP